MRFQKISILNPRRVTGTSDWDGSLKAKTSKGICELKLPGISRGLGRGGGGRLEQNNLCGRSTCMDIFCNSTSQIMMGVILILTRTQHPRQEASPLQSILNRVLDQDMWFCNVLLEIII